MTFKKYNTSNNAICLLSLPITNESLVIKASWNFNRFSTANFIIKISEFDWDWIVIWRENIHIASRTWDTFIVEERCVEKVPINDNTNSTVKQALNFGAWSIIEEVFSSEWISDIQNELIRLNDEKLDKWWLRQTLSNIWSLFFSNDWWNETALPLWVNGRVLQSNWTTSPPTWEVPTVDINALTNDDTLWSDDKLIFYKNWVANRKRKAQATTSNAWLVRQATTLEIANQSNDETYISPKWAHEKFWINSYTITTLSTPAWTYSTPAYSTIVWLWYDTIITVTMKWHSWSSNLNTQWIQYSTDWWLSWNTLYSRTVEDNADEEILIVRVQKWYWIRVFQWWTWSLAADMPVIAKFQN